MEDWKLQTSPKFQCCPMHLVSRLRFYGLKFFNERNQFGIYGFLSILDVTCTLYGSSFQATLGEELATLLLPYARQELLENKLKWSTCAPALVPRDNL